MLALTLYVYPSGFENIPFLMREIELKGALGLGKHFSGEFYKWLFHDLHLLQTRWSASF